MVTGGAALLALTGRAVCSAGTGCVAEQSAAGALTLAGRRGATQECSDRDGWLVLA